MSTFWNRLLVANLWNAGLICIVLCMKWLLRSRLSVRSQYHCWYVLLGSALLAFLPVDFLSQWQVPTVGVQTFSISDSVSRTQSSDWDAGWLQDAAELLQRPENDRLSAAFLLIWLLGVLVMAGIYGYGLHRLYRIKRFSAEPSQRVKDCLERCGGNSSRVVLRQSDCVKIPVSFGICRSCVILPSVGIETLSGAEIEHILLHELTHARHGDLITNYLFCGVQALFWFNPVVWLGLRRMRRDREAYCDWSVMDKFSGEAERLAYGRTLLRFAAGDAARFHTANGLCQSKKQLKYRLEQIANFQRETGWKRISGSCVAVLLLLAAAGQLPVYACCARTSDVYAAFPETAAWVEADWSGFFAGADGCAVVYDLNTGVYTVSDKREVTRRVPPCSTYKIYSALNALEQGIITADENEIAWDGTQYSFAAWNRDQTLRSAMQQSVNWYFQMLDRMAGEAQLKQFYEQIGYGNCVFYGDPDEYWYGGNLKISALEQVELLVKLYQNEFGFEDDHLAAVWDAMALNTPGLYGKTGTGQLDGVNVVGWFVGFYETPENTCFIAVCLDSDNGADGALACETAINILKRISMLQ